MKKTSNVAPWSDFIGLRSRYQRSVHLERDVGEAAALDGYVVSPLARTLVRRIVAGLESEIPSRAWSITGPYGTGKSAFALFLASALNGVDPARQRVARQLLGASDKALAAQLAEGLHAGRGLAPVVVTGERRALEYVLLSALLRTAETVWQGRGRRPDVLEEIRTAVAGEERGKRVAPRHVVELIRAFARVAAQKANTAGLLIILDEAGKVLEFAADAPERGDLQLMQELAEAANRSGDTPIVFVSILHQSFEQYAARLSQMQRSDWAKVQGRFEDVPYQEAGDHLVRLIAESLSEGQLPRHWRERAAEAAKETLGVVRAGAAEIADLERTLTRCAPLHPIAALAAGPLFRSALAQNERSLFAFLASTEPGGFRSFLEDPVNSGEMFAIDGLFDYVKASLGSRLFGATARLWGQAELALARLPQGATVLDARLIKAVAVLTAIGDGGAVTASRGVLIAALAGTHGASKRDVEGALDRLRERGGLVFRKYKDAFQLWDGSDLDVDALIADAAKRAVLPGSVARRLSKVLPPHPIVPRRHALTTGTVRYFEVRYADESILDDPFAASPEADGTVCVVVPSDERAERHITLTLGREDGLFWVTRVGGKRKPFVVAVPRSCRRIRDLTRETAAIEWALTNTAELRDDVVARRELAGRLSEAERLLREEMRSILSGDVPSDWFYESPEGFSIESTRGLLQKLSSICDDRYGSAPKIQNELINRHYLSSAAAAARRDLMEAMITKSREHRLGIEGFPPALSMYLSVLEKHKLHREEDGVSRLMAPTNPRRGSMKVVWDAMLAFLARHEGQRVRLTDLYEHLRQPPFGLRDGVLPVLVLALLLERAADIALFEDVIFVPSVAPAVAERILRAPEKFELQRVAITGARAALIKALDRTPKQDATLIAIVKEIVMAAAGLPEYSRNTRRVSAQAVAVREVLLRAKEPAPLLFRQLPAAVGLPAFEATDGHQTKEIGAFVSKLRESLRELTSAYDRLMKDIAAKLAQSFGLSAEISVLRQALSMRASHLVGVPTETSLKSFLFRVADRELKDDEWLLSLSTLLGGKPPEHWQDTDVEHAFARLAAVRRSFFAAEGLSFAMQRVPVSDDGFLLRMAIARPGRPEAEAVVSVPPERVASVHAAADKVRRALSGSGLARTERVAALAAVAQELMRDEEVAERPHTESSEKTS